VSQSSLISPPDRSVGGRRAAQHAHRSASVPLIRLRPETAWASPSWKEPSSTSLKPAHGCRLSLAPRLRAWASWVHFASRGLERRAQAPCRARRRPLRLRPHFPEFAGIAASRRGNWKNPDNRLGELVTPGPQGLDEHRRKECARGRNFAGRRRLPLDLLRPRPLQRPAVPTAAVSNACRVARRIPKPQDGRGPPTFPSPSPAAFQGRRRPQAGRGS